MENTYTSIKDVLDKLNKDAYMGYIQQELYFFGFPFFVEIHFGCYIALTFGFDYLNLLFLVPFLFYFVPLYS